MKLADKVMLILLLLLLPQVVYATPNMPLWAFVMPPALTIGFQFLFAYIFFRLFRSSSVSKFSLFLKSLASYLIFILIFSHVWRYFYFYYLTGDILGTKLIWIFRMLYMIIIPIEYLNSLSSLIIQFLLRVLFYGTINLIVIFKFWKRIPHQIKPT